VETAVAIGSTLSSFAWETMEDGSTIDTVGLTIIVWVKVERKM
jgi:hypothetical protein